MNWHRNKRGGFIQTIIIIVVVLIILGYFGFNMAEIIKKPAVERNLVWAGNVAQVTWDRFLSKPAVYVWDTFLSAIGRSAEDRLKSATTTNSTN